MNFLKIFMYVFYLCWVFVVHGLSLIPASGGRSLVVVHGLLTAGASLVAEHGLKAHGLSRCGAWAWLFCGMWDPPRPGILTDVPCIARWIRNHWTTREAQK